MKRDWTYHFLLCTVVALVGVIGWGWYYWSGKYNESQWHLDQAYKQLSREWRFEREQDEENDSLYKANDSLKRGIVYIKYGISAGTNLTVSGTVGATWIGGYWPKGDVDSSVYIDWEKVHPGTTKKH
jgi:hypothetical protein